MLIHNISKRIAGTRGMGSLERFLFLLRFSGYIEHMYAISTPITNSWSNTERNLNSEFMASHFFPPRSNSWIASTGYLARPAQLLTNHFCKIPFNFNLTSTFPLRSDISPVWWFPIQNTVCISFLWMRATCRVHRNDLDPNRPSSTH